MSKRIKIARSRRPKIKVPKGYYLGTYTSCFFEGGKKTSRIFLFRDDNTWGRTIGETARPELGRPQELGYTWQEEQITSGIIPPTVEQIRNTEFWLSREKWTGPF